MTYFTAFILTLQKCTIAQIPIQVFWFTGAVFIDHIHDFLNPSWCHHKFDVHIYIASSQQWYFTICFLFSPNFLQFHYLSWLVGKLLKKPQCSRPGCWRRLVIFRTNTSHPPLHYTTIPFLLHIVSLLHPTAPLYYTTIPFLLYIVSFLQTTLHLYFIALPFLLYHFSALSATLPSTSPPSHLSTISSHCFTSHLSLFTLSQCPTSIKQYLRIPPAEVDLCFSFTENCAKKLEWSKNSGRCK